MTTKLVLFDCDGTLVDSARRIHETMRRAFVAFGYPEPGYDAVKATIGLSLDVAMAELLGRAVRDSEIVEIRKYFKSLFAEVHADPSMTEQLFEGIDTLIGALSQQDDIIIGAVTGNSRRGLEHVLSMHGLKPHFSVSRTADDCPSKPNPAMVLECCADQNIHPANAVVIGDAAFDMAMAVAAGAGSIGVSWGYGSVSDLKKAGAGAIASHPDEIPALLLGERDLSKAVDCIDTIG